jgi:uncharacterized protein YggL (DUF469 family)
MSWEGDTLEKQFVDLAKNWLGWIRGQYDEIEATTKDPKEMDGFLDNVIAQTIVVFEAGGYAFDAKNLSEAVKDYRKIGV